MVKLREAVRWNKGRSVLWQVLLVLLALLYVAGLHWSNDGLWYQGDSPRHAANGLFWWNFLANFPVNPVKFGLSYYARYPVIHPTAYPPGFYLIEGVAFRLFGPSPFVAKGLVLGFAFIAGIYMTAWVRCWVSQEAGWGSALLILQPGIIRWANVIMLNVPSMALGLAALYHGRRWIESPASRHFYIACFFAVFGILTYVHSGIVLFVILAWIFVEWRWRVLLNRRVIIMGLISVLVLLPWLFIISRWAPSHLAGVFPTSQFISGQSRWTFYFNGMLELFTPLLLALAIIGFFVSLRDQHLRKEVIMAIIWIIVCYFGFSYIIVRELRYILLIIPPIVILSIIGFISILHWTAAWLNKDTGLFFIVGVVAILMIHVSTAPLVRVSRAAGFQEVVAFFEKEAPEERIFYDGNYNGIFSFLMLSKDQHLKRGVVLGHKLLYTSAITPTWLLNERVSSSDEVIEVLRKEGGCKWLAIEDLGASDQIPAAKYLRQALTRSEFQFVQSFQIRALRATRVDVYRFLPPVEEIKEIELRFPGLGEKGVFRAKPIEQNSTGFQ